MMNGLRFLAAGLPVSVPGGGLRRRQGVAADADPDSRSHADPDAHADADAARHRRRSTRWSSTRRASKGRRQPTATVTLTAAAPAGGAVIVLQSGNTDMAKVPAQRHRARRPEDRHVHAWTRPPCRPHTGDDAGVLSGRHQAVRADGSRSGARSPSSPSPRPRRAPTPVGHQLERVHRLPCSMPATSNGFVARYPWTLTVGSTRIVIHGRQQPVYTPTTDVRDLQGGGTPDSNDAIGMTVHAGARGSRRKTNSQRHDGGHPVSTGKCGY